MRLRILFVEYTSSVSGAQRSLLELLGSLSAEHDLLLACPAGQLADLARERGARIIQIPESQLGFKVHPIENGRAAWRMAQGCLRLRRIVRESRPDVVHANSVRAGLLLAALPRGTRTVIHVRDVLPDIPSARVVKRFSLGRATRVIAVSEYAAQSFAGDRWGERGVRVIFNAVDVERFDATRFDGVRDVDGLGLTGRPVIALIAQITPWKGHDLALLALSRIRRTHPDARLVLVGSVKFASKATRFDNAAFHQQLRASAKDLGIEAHVTFLGERDDPEAVLAASDVLVVPSDVEPFGRTVIEALAMDVPVVATSRGGPREVIRDGVDGFVLEPTDPAAWADAIHQALDLDLGAAGSRERIARLCSPARHLAEVFAVYREAVAPAGG